MLKKPIILKKEVILIVITALVVGISVNTLKKTELKIPYPPIQQLATDFDSLLCEEVSRTYMRAWPQDSDLMRSSAARVQLSLSEEKTREWKSGYRDANGNMVSTSKVKKATVVLDLKDNKITFTGDGLWYLENQPFDIIINNQHKLTGTLAISKEEQPRYDIAGTFMLDKNTSFLILSSIETALTQNGSFGSRSRLFTCRKSNRDF